MADSQGSISYTTDIDTSNTLQAEKVMDKATKKIVADFKRADDAVDLFNAQLKDAGRTVDQFGQVIGKNGKVVFAATERYQKLQWQLRSAKKDFDNLGGSTKKSGRSLADMSKNSGQASIQVQQFVGQIQGGQSAMLAFSQQAADLGIVLGFPLLGAVAGISASLAGMLIKSLGGAADATENLEEKLKKLVETTILTEEQSAYLVDLRKTENKERDKTIKILDKEIRGKQFSLDLVKKSISNYEKESKTYKNYAKSIENMEKELNKLTAAKQILSAETKKANDDIKLYNSLTGDKSVTASKDQIKATDDLIKAMKIKNQMMNLTEKEQLELTLTNMKATAIQKEQAMLAYTIYEANMKEAKSIEAKRVEKEKENKEAERRKRSGVAMAERVVSEGKSPIQLLEEQHVKLEELRALDIENDKLYKEALAANEKKQTELTQQQTDKRIAIKQEESDAINSANSLLLASTGSLFGAMADMLKASGDEQSGTYKAMFALSKSFAVASATLNFGVAVSQAMADPTAVTLPQKLANYATVMSTGGALISSISSAAFSGRQYGGPTTAGSSYRVNETGTPEIYSEGGKDYLMNSGGGKVTPMEQVGGGATNMNVNVENYGNDNVKVERISDRDIKIVIGEITNQMDRNQGAFPRALKSNTNMQSRKGNR